MQALKLQHLPESNQCQQICTRTAKKQKKTLEIRADTKQKLQRHCAPAKHCDLCVSPAADPTAVMGCPITLVLLLTYLTKSYGYGHDHTSTCPNQCYAELGWGSCQPHKREGRHMFTAGSAMRMHFRKTLPQGSCRCIAGHGGKDCSFQMSTIYFSEKVYSGLEVQPLDLQGWGSGMPETVALYKRLCEV